MITAMIASRTGMISCQAMMAMTKTKRKAKGRSMKAVTEAEVMKSRTDSKERRFDENAPTAAGRDSMRTPSTLSMIRAESCMSIRALARSMK